MSKLWSTPLRDTRPNRRNSSVPKLQCRGHRSEDLYVTSPTTTDKIPEKKTSRDHRDFNRNRCGRAGRDQGGEKIDGRSRRGAELAYRSVKRDPCRQVCGGHFRSEDGRGHDAFKN